MTNYKSFLVLLILASLCIPVVPAVAAEKQPVNFVLDWIIGGRHTGWFAALHKGYYDEEGLAVKISRGFGSGRGIKRAVGGQADISFNDIATAILARAREGAPLKAVMVSYTKHPSAIFTHKKYNIKTPKDLEGATLADSAGSTNVLLFPAFAKSAGFDANKVKWVLVAPNAKMSVFIADKVQGTLFYNMQLPIMQKKTAAQGGVNMIEFGDYLKLYSNGLLVTEDYLAKNPDLVRRFLRASIKGWEFTFEHPDEAVKMLLKDQPLLDPATSKAEALIVQDLMQSPEAKKHGLGYMDEGKMRQTRDLMLRLNDVKTTVPLSDIYTNDYLPTSR
jgi:NitT/TauT family transport system substrate-binding protein